MGYHCTHQHQVDNVDPVTLTKFRDFIYKFAATTITTTNGEKNKRVLVYEGDNQDITGTLNSSLSEACKLARKCDFFFHISIKISIF